VLSLSRLPGPGDDIQPYQNDIQPYQNLFAMTDWNMADRKKWSD
jgi:hypothetical protein